MFAAALAVTATAPALAQDSRGPAVVRYGNTTPVFSYDGRGDDRDFATNGVFPGNFAPDPTGATLGGAAGVTGGFYRRSPWPYPSQVTFGSGRPNCSASRSRRARAACLSLR